MTAQAGIAGTWNLVISTPRGERPATLILEQDGGEVTGKMNEVAIDDVAWADGKLTFTARLTEPVKVKVKCSLHVEGETMSGSAKAGRLPMSAAVTGTLVTA
jgi:hypothetical protein